MPLSTLCVSTLYTELHVESLQDWFFLLRVGVQKRIQWKGLGHESVKLSEIYEEFLSSIIQKFENPDRPKHILSICFEITGMWTKKEARKLLFSQIIWDNTWLTLKKEMQPQAIPCHLSSLLLPFWLPLKPQTKMVSRQTFQTCPQRDSSGF